MTHDLIYKEEYFKHQYNISYYENRLRFGDQFLSICYALNIALLDVLSNPEFENLSFRDFIWDNHHGDYLSKLQFNFFKKQFTAKNYLRVPKSIIEIGSGRGEVTAFLNFCKENIDVLNFELQSIDPSPDFCKMYAETCQRLFNKHLEQNLIQHTLKNSINLINFENIDTVILCESLEHLTESEFYEFIEYGLPYFQKNKTRLIIVNAWGFWPIIKNDYDHIWELNDEVYDRIEKLGKQTILRSKSHLVIEF